MACTGINLLTHTYIVALSSTVGKRGMGSSHQDLETENELLESLATRPPACTHYR